MVKWTTILTVPVQAARPAAGTAYEKLLRQSRHRSGNKVAPHNASSLSCTETVDLCTQDYPQPCKQTTQQTSRSGCGAGQNISVVNSASSSASLMIPRRMQSQQKQQYGSLSEKQPPRRHEAMQPYRQQEREGALPGLGRADVCGLGGNGSLARGPASLTGNRAPRKLANAAEQHASKPPSRHQARWDTLTFLPS